MRHILDEIKENDEILIDINDINEFNQNLANQIIEKPLYYIDEIKMAICVFKNKPIGTEYQIILEYSNLTHIDEIKSSNLNQLITIEGIIFQSGPIIPLPLEIEFTCNICGNIMPLEQNPMRDLFEKPYTCSNPNCQSKKFEEKLIKTIDCRKIKLLEMNEDGSFGNNIEIWLTEKLIGNIKPGDKIKITGVYDTYIQKGNKSSNGDYNYRVWALNQKLIRKFSGNCFLNSENPNPTEIIQEYLIDYLSEKGKFLVNKKFPNVIDGIFYLYGYKVIPISITIRNGYSFHPEFLRLIPSHIKEKSKKDYLILDRILERSINFPMVEIYKDFYYDNIENQIYISDGHIGYYFISESEITHFENGDYNKYFIFDSKSKFREANLKEPRDIRDILNTFEFYEEVNDDFGLKKKHNVDFLYAYMLSVIFSSIIPEKPILNIIGDPRSGKTTLNRIIIKFLIGLHEDVGSLGSGNKIEEDLTLYLINRLIASLDNLETITSGMTDIMCKASTGNALNTRLTYDRSQSSILISCFLIMNGIDPNTRRGDLLSRMIIVRLKARKEFLSLDSFFDINNIGKFFGKFLQDLQKILGIVKRQEKPSSHRMARFFHVFFCALEVLGLNKEEIKEIYNRVVQTLQEFNMEKDEILSTLIDLINGNAMDENGNSIENSDLGTGIKTSDLLKKMKMAGLEISINSKQLARKLKYITGLENAGIEKMTITNPHANLRHWVFKKKNHEPKNELKEKEYHNLKKIIERIIAFGESSLIMTKEDLLDSLCSEGINSNQINDSLNNLYDKGEIIFRDLTKNEFQIRSLINLKSLLNKFI